MKQQPVLLLPKFRAKSLQIFTRSPQKVTVVCGIDCLMNNPLDDKENDEHALRFALSCLSPFFGFAEFGLSVYGLCFLTQMLV
jgi:hypothetical protein